jgi:hypothetical protein
MTYLLMGTTLCLQFTKAVESKQVAQQDAERARFVVMRADQVPCCDVQHTSLATHTHTPRAMEHMLLPSIHEFTGQAMHQRDGRFASY